MLKEKFFVGQLGTLELIEDVGATDLDFLAPKDTKRFEQIAYGVMALVCVVFLALVISAPKTTPKIEEELKQQVVKIVKNIDVVKKATVKMNVPKETPQSTVKTKTAHALKRMGALAALGSLSKSNQKSGLNLGAVNTTVGPKLS